MIFYFWAISFYLLRPGEILFSSQPPDLSLLIFTSFLHSSKAGGYEQLVEWDHSSSFWSFICLYLKICEKYEGSCVFLLKTCLICVTVARKLEVCKNLAWMPFTNLHALSGNCPVGCTTMQLFKRFLLSVILTPGQDFAMYQNPMPIGGVFLQESFYWLWGSSPTASGPFVAIPIARAVLQSDWSNGLCHIALPLWWGWCTLIQIKLAVHDLGCVQSS